MKLSAKLRKVRYEMANFSVDAIQAPVPQKRINPFLLSEHSPIVKQPRSSALPDSQLKKFFVHFSANIQAEFQKISDTVKKEASELLKKK